MARRLFLERIGLILLGSAILAFGVYNFYYLNNITEGGVLGILLLLKNLFNIQPAIANIVIDGLLLLVGYKFFGKKFLIYSIVASISFSVLYDLFEAIGPLVPQSQNMLLSTILAGITVGVGVGIIVKAGCASGGDDALALVISKTTSLNIGQVYLATDVIVLLLSLVYLSAFDIFYSLIAVTISGKVIDFIYYHGKNLDMDMSNEIVPEC
ncbi:MULTISPECIES: YitT family protein [unclassified Clostridioides]|uniref:YitT family protein n=1 Tax=unclassified Clostridioides TaxID=2635829 RepID=UPI001D0C72C9|nr:YitT family protein [Clostridioides sp. ES-S-0049-03]MCC0652101.1 YitT family protein [Clostridioides sp. ES-S-0001-03]MCC0674659.1 YitT family protein [Clostridioides sp. ES-W-0018-02]MCC0694480.1 YitT family protein [Clostridioides sp. ES-S-0048-02]MCC0708670.1 YitT family protein [Clostridioides sp. ES-S-0190-01]MCC0710526.1 YitT family protein [Clostridioides sp. ES-W-0017-02]MCC0761984.1 YitT family protein [Clostridioides sp. ES-S-0006-03]UDN57020.1 YitT family protein [Clostridioid